MATNAYRSWLIAQLPPATRLIEVNGAWREFREPRLDRERPNLGNIKTLEETDANDN